MHAGLRPGIPASAWQVMRLPTEERVPGASAVARFVGVEACEDADGHVLCDLFAREDESGVWFEEYPDNLRSESSRDMPWRSDSQSHALHPATCAASFLIPAAL